MHSLDTEEDCRLRMNSGEETETVCWTERILGGRGCLLDGEDTSRKRMFLDGEIDWKKREVGRRGRSEGEEG